MVSRVFKGLRYLVISDSWRLRLDYAISSAFLRGMSSSL